MLRNRDLLVLCYHAVSPTWPADLAIPPSLLARQLEFLVGRGYRGATFTESVLAPPSGRTLVVTFDDAYRSVLTLGKPVLDRFGIPGTVFVPTAYPDAGEPMAWPGIEMWKGGAHEHELTPMSWNELSGLGADGWEIGSHTVSHPRLTACADKQLLDELVESRRTCEDALGIRCRSLAYPYGNVDQRVVRGAGAAGYEAAAALPRRPHAERSLEWPRVGVYRPDALLRFAVKSAGSVRRLRDRLGR